MAGDGTRLFVPSGGDIKELHRCGATIRLIGESVRLSIKVDVIRHKSITGAILLKPARRRLLATSIGFNMKMSCNNGRLARLQRNAFALQHSISAK